MCDVVVLPRPSHQARRSVQHSLWTLEYDVRDAVCKRVTVIQVRRDKRVDYCLCRDIYHVVDCCLR